MNRNEKIVVTREVTYTDDCDLITEDPKVKNKITTEMSEILKTGNRPVNGMKTETTSLKRYSKNRNMERNEDIRISSWS